jgi:hypothetical protein
MIRKMTILWWLFSQSYRALQSSRAVSMLRQHVSKKPQQDFAAAFV